MKLKPQSNKFWFVFAIAIVNVFNLLQTENRRIRSFIRRKRDAKRNVVFKTTTNKRKNSDWKMKNKQHYSNSNNNNNKKCHIVRFQVYCC